MKGARAGRGVGNAPKQRVRPNFEWRIRWRIPELTPKTPRPVASADYVDYNEL